MPEVISVGTESEDQQEVDSRDAVGFIGLRAARNASEDNVCVNVVIREYHFLSLADSREGCKMIARDATESGRSDVDNGHADGACKRTRPDKNGTPRQDRWASFLLREQLLGM